MSIPQPPGTPYGYPAPPPPAELRGAKPTPAQTVLRFVLLIVFVGGLYGLIFTDRAAEALAVLGVIYVGSLITGALSFVSARIYGRRVVSLRCGGFGQFRFRVRGKQLLCVSPVPIFFSARAVETTRSLGRGWRSTRLAAILLWIALAALGLVLFPDPGSVYFAFLVFFILVMNTVVPDPASGRRGVARLFSRPDARDTPTIADPRRVAALNAAIDAQFGDFASAQAVLAQLEADPEGAEAAALLRIDIAEMRGDFAAALALPWPPAGPDAPAHVVRLRDAMVATRRARLVLLAAEQTQQAAPYALAEANALFASVPRTATAAFGGAGVRALLALATGNAKQARGANKLSVGAATTAGALAGALCDKALIETAMGDPRGRGSQALAQAAQLAPWYPRVTTVHSMISGTAIPMQSMPMDALHYAAPSQQPMMPADPWDTPPV